MSWIPNMPVMNNIGYAPAPANQQQTYEYIDLTVYDAPQSQPHCPGAQPASAPYCIPAQPMNPAVPQQQHPSIAPNNNQDILVPIPTAAVNGMRAIAFQYGFSFYGLCREYIQQQQKEQEDYIFRLRMVVIGSAAAHYAGSRDQSIPPHWVGDSGYDPIRQQMPALLKRGWDYWQTQESNARIDKWMADMTARLGAPPQPSARPKNQAAPPPPPPPTEEEQLINQYYVQSLEAYTADMEPPNNTVGSASQAPVASNAPPIANNPPPNYGITDLMAMGQPAYQPQALINPPPMANSPPPGYGFTDPTVAGPSMDMEHVIALAARYAAESHANQPPQLETNVDHQIAGPSTWPLDGTANPVVAEQGNITDDIDLSYYDDIDKYFPRVQAPNEGTSTQAFDAVAEPFVGGQDMGSTDMDFSDADIEACLTPVQETNNENDSGQSQVQAQHPSTNEQAKEPVVDLDQDFGVEENFSGIPDDVLACMIQDELKRMRDSETRVNVGGVDVGADGIGCS